MSNIILGDKLLQVEVPDCTAPYHTEPMIFAGCFFGGLFLLIAVTVLIVMWLDGRNR